jgi:hypothetical protein
MKAIIWKRMRCRKVHRILLEFGEKAAFKGKKEVMVCIRNILFSVRTSGYTEVMLTRIKQSN